MESNSICNYTSDNKIRQPRSRSLICLSRVWLQAKLDDAKSYYQLLLKITISKKRRIAKLWQGSVNCRWLRPRLWLVDFNYNFEYDWLIELSDKKLTDNNLASELLENKSFFKLITIEEIAVFMITADIVKSKLVDCYLQCNIKRHQATLSWCDAVMDFSIRYHRKLKFNSHLFWLSAKASKLLKVY